ncbi:glycosyltransferase family 4 protein [soil metagenome]
MKILMLTPYLPYPPASGGQIRTLYLLKYLAKRHDITLVALYKSENEKKYAKYLAPYCKRVYLCKRATRPWQPGNIIKAVTSLLPFLVVRNFSKEAEATVTKLLKEEHFDVIHAETFYIMPHIPKTDTPILLVEQTIEFKVYQHFISSLPFFIRYPLSIDIYKLKYWEKYFWKKADLVATVSESDKEEINKLLPEINPVIIPNGAGDEMFVDTLQEPDVKDPILLFVGNFFWLQNVEAAIYLLEKIFPKVLEKFPKMRLVIAGQNSNKMKRIATKNVSIVNLAPNDGEKVKDLYHTATLFIAPIFGPGGTRLKILASMASGLPVVSTQTGVEGLQVKDGKHVLLAHNPDEFVDKISMALNDVDLYRKIQKNSFDHVKLHYSWDALADKLEKVYRKIIK